MKALPTEFPSPLSFHFIYFVCHVYKCGQAYTSQKTTCLLLTQVIRLDSKFLHPLSHLAGPKSSFFNCINLSFLLPEPYQVYFSYSICRYNFPQTVLVSTCFCLFLLSHSSYPVFTFTLKGPMLNNNFCPSLHVPFYIFYRWKGLVNQVMTKYVTIHLAFRDVAMWKKKSLHIVKQPQSRLESWLSGCSCRGPSLVPSTQMAINNLL